MNILIVLLILEFSLTVGVLYFIKNVYKYLKTGKIEFSPHVRFHFYGKRALYWTFVYLIFFALLLLFLTFSFLVLLL